MRTTIRHPSIAVLLVCLSACASAGSAGDGSSPRFAQQVGTVEVTNDGHDDVILYMFRDGVRYRLGRVARMETGHFRIPAAAVGDLPSYQVQLVAEPVGNSPSARPFSTGLISWRPGQNLAGRVARNFTSEQFVLVTH
jgi:hypothetical protein